MAIAPDVLSRVPFLAGLSAKSLRTLAGSMHERIIPAGETVMTQGKGGIAFFVVLQGTAIVSVDGAERRTLGPGEHFGEIALVLPDAPRTASVTAASDLHVATLTAWNFRPFVRDEPEVAWNLLETIARRVAATPGA